MENLDYESKEFKYYEVTKENPVIIKLETSKRKKLYHYTNEVGAKGIQESNSLWVTHSSFLDDATEIRYISIVLDGVLKYLNDEGRKFYDRGIEGQEYVYEAIIKTLKSLSDMYKVEIPIDGGNLFILSLTENRNNKYLHKNYCGEKGAIFEFNNNTAKLFMQNGCKLFAMSAKVVYSYTKQMILLLKDIEEFYRELLENLIMEQTIDYQELIETIKTVIRMKIINYSFFFKDSKYSNEAEYRVVFLVLDECNDKIVKYRKKSTKDIPYIDIKLKKEDIIYRNV